ncbi:uncharacterized protein LOC120090666 [Benincasa hispida]|uniref:uncharacterized protein LOC120090666 n=1 Tax=Benincasa hispida TaxID=102211 RepID=UPI0019006AD4|nr:uncharacterized protein LOC120090666 [Benincasa hispida]
MSLVISPITVHEFDLATAQGTHTYVSNDLDICVENDSGTYTPVSHNIAKLMIVLNSKTNDSSDDCTKKAVCNADMAGNERIKATIPDNTISSETLSRHKTQHNLGSSLHGCEQRLASPLARCEKCVSRWLGSGKIDVLIVYVDDIVLSRDDVTEIDRLKKKMAEEFEIKGLGRLRYFLKIEVAQSKEGIFVS